MAKQKLKKSLSIFNIIPFLFFIVLVIQLFITYCYTNTKRFSIMALLRNSTFVIFIYLFIKTRKFFYLLLPFLIEIIIEYVKYAGYQIDKYIATEYLYSDYFKNLVEKNSIYSNFTEGLYDNIFGIDTLDHSPENLKIILDWTKNVYNTAYKNKSQQVIGLNGKKFDDMHKIKKYAETNKFKRICDICKIDKDMKILEIGFGECNFMNYIKDVYGIKAVGVSISEEQVKLAKSRGFEAYHLDMWNITDNIGKFDLILQCGNLEYVRCCNETNDKYEKYFKIIQKVLNKDGKYFITCLHQPINFMKNFTFYDYVRSYFLLFGNDGSYPNGKYTLSEYANKANLKKLHQEEHTNDYFIETVFYMSTYGFIKKESNRVNTSGIIDALIKTMADPYYIHSYLCFSSTKDYYWNPWLWGFVPQQRENWFGQYVTLEYILFKNNA